MMVTHEMPAAGPGAVVYDVAAGRDDGDVLPERMTCKAMRRDLDAARVMTGERSAVVRLRARPCDLAAMTMCASGSGETAQFSARRTMTSRAIFKFPKSSAARIANVGGASLYWLRSCGHVRVRIMMRAWGAPSWAEAHTGRARQQGTSCGCRGEPSERTSA